MAKLTRNGIVGLELTREEVIDLKGRLTAILRKAQCREVNCEVLDLFEHVESELGQIDDRLTEIIEDVVEEDKKKSAIKKLLHPHSDMSLVEKYKLINTHVVQVFSVRASNYLKVANINTIKELVQSSPDGLFENPYFKRKSRIEIENFLDRYNLWLGMTDADIQKWLELEKC